MPAAETRVTYIFACLQIPRALQSNKICKSLGPLLGETLNENTQASRLPNILVTFAQTSNPVPWHRSLSYSEGCPKKDERGRAFVRTGIGCQPPESKKAQCESCTELWSASATFPRCWTGRGFGEGRRIRTGFRQQLNKSANRMWKGQASYQETYCKGRVKYTKVSLGGMVAHMTTLLFSLTKRPERLPSITQLSRCSYPDRGPYHNLTNWFLQPSRSVSINSPDLS